MPTLAEWTSMSYDAGLALQRTFWKPLRNTMDIFHVLPLAVVVIIFFLLTTDGQVRELYVSYLEGPSTDDLSDWLEWIFQMTVGLALVGAISAVLFEAHYALSTMRLNIVYSSYSNPDSNSMMRALQKTAGFILAFSPWLALAVGLFNARNFVAERYCQLLTLLKHNDITSLDIANMNHLWLPSGWAIGGALTFLGAITCWFITVGEQRRDAQRAVAICAPVIAVLLIVLLTDWLDFAHPLSKRSFALGCLTILMMAIYFSIYLALYKKRGAFYFSGRGVSLSKRRRLWFAIWAIFPWLCLAAYFITAQYWIAPIQLGAPWPRCPLSASLLPMRGYWAAFPVAMCYTVAIGLLVGHQLGRFSGFGHRRHAVIVAIAALAAFAALVSRINVADAVAIYQGIGPLGTMMLQLLLLISALALLAALSQRSGFPIILLATLALVFAFMFPNHLLVIAGALGLVCVCLAAIALVSRQQAITLITLVLPIIVGVQVYETFSAPMVGQNQKSVTDKLGVKYQFSCWLNLRGVPSSESAAQQDPNCRSAASGALARKKWPAATKYPVFIVAVEGGGIYAASAASVFLARLEDLASEFDDHVFTISGVSGGSIGAAVFQALDHAAHQHTESEAGGSVDRTQLRDEGSHEEQNPRCPQYPRAQAGSAERRLELRAKNVMETDHFSPVIGSVFTEILGFPLSRPDALVASLESATAAEDERAGEDLCAPFSQHWNPGSFAPALALNATWVETGFRAAFAPFTLNDLDESLYSFTDPLMPTEKLSLMQAAGVSARFPGLMPPLSAVINPQKRWNFVDGGYSDNSGATTAMDIYKALESVSPQNVDLRLILITSSVPQPDLASNAITGTVFRDTAAPVNALMKVREDLGNDAVARACTYVYQDDRSQAARSGQKSGKISLAVGASEESNEICLSHAGGLYSPLSLVEIQDQTYGLSLGWKISKTSFDVVAWMLGRPDTCPGRGPQGTRVLERDQPDVAATVDNPNAQLSGNIVERNSCVLKTIVELVNGSLSSAVTSGPQSPAH